MNSLRDITFECIHNRYHWGKYGDFKVIVDINTGYVNATHLCNLTVTKTGSQKRFRDWLTITNTKELIKELSASAVLTADELMIVASGVKKRIKGNVRSSRSDSSHRLVGFACFRYQG